jgi:hypothetical protein
MPGEVQRLSMLRRLQGELQRRGAAEWAAKAQEAARETFIEMRDEIA